MSNDKLRATFSGGESDKPVSAPPVPGVEIDFRPHPALKTGQDTQNLTELARRVRAAEEAERLGATVDWPAGHTTGAFVSAAASIRHEVAPYRWWQAVGSMALLYSAVIGVPLGLIAFAVYEIVRRAH